MKNTIYLAVASLLFINCNGQNKKSRPIGDEPVDFENFSFNTTEKDLFPDKNLSKSYKNFYEIKGFQDTQIVERDSTFSEPYSKTPKHIGWEYLQKSTSSIDTIAIFDEQIFQKICLATTLDGKVKAIGGVSDELTKEQSDDFLKKLTKKYGTPKKLTTSWSENFTTYEWTKSDRIIRYVPAFDDENSTLKIVVDEENKTFTEGEKEPHFEGYLFIINPELKNETLTKMKTGDFVFLRTEEDGFD